VGKRAPSLHAEVGFADRTLVENRDESPAFAQLRRIGVRERFDSPINEDNVIWPGGGITVRQRTCHDLRAPIAKLAHGARRVGLRIGLVSPDPADGDYRVQEHHGGRVIPHEPTEDEFAVAAATLAAAPAATAYARVDLVQVAGSAAVMELEAIEPQLFLDHDVQAAARFAAHIATLLP